MFFINIFLAASAAALACSQSLVSRANDSSVDVAKLHRRAAEYKLELSLQTLRITGDNGRASAVGAAFVAKIGQPGEPQASRDFWLKLSTAQSKSYV